LRLSKQREGMGEKKEAAGCMCLSAKTAAIRVVRRRKQNSRTIQSKAKAGGARGARTNRVGGERKTARGGGDPQGVV
jgi:hypothetical protein